MESIRVVIVNRWFADLSFCICSIESESWNLEGYVFMYLFKMHVTSWSSLHTINTFIFLVFTRYEHVFLFQL